MPTLKETLAQLSEKYLQQEVNSFDASIAKLLTAAVEKGSKIPPYITVEIKQIPTTPDGWTITASFPQCSFTTSGSTRTSLNRAALVEILKDAGGAEEKATHEGLIFTFSLLPK